MSEIQNQRNLLVHAAGAGAVFLLALIPPLLVGGPGQLSAAVKGEFQAPAIDSFILHGESDGDGDGDGINETHIRRYLNKSGDSVFSMASGNILWAWSLNTSGSDDAEMNYVIRDSNCDGTFDEKYGLDDEFHVPECVNGN